MGREVKRVPLDFDWPIRKIWKGYINPFYKECPEKGKTCFDGETAGGAWLSAIVRLLMIAGENTKTQERHSGTWLHPYLQEYGLAPYRGGSILLPSSDLAELTTGLAGREPGMLGHDCIDHFAAQKEIIKAAKMKKGWGVCPICGGENIDPDMKDKYEEWEPSKPPTGEGWQMWETVSDGSPISPVFKTPEELAKWLTETKASACGSNEESYENWLEMIKIGWAPSMVYTPEKGIQSGVRGYR